MTIYFLKFSLEVFVPGGQSVGESSYVIGKDEVGQLTF
jgi:hypothetical protein